jgi:hypothetical protein
MLQRYPDKPPTASDGRLFEQLCQSLLKMFLGYGQEVDVFPDAARQFSLGENAAGIEYKELKKAWNWLRIECFERTALAKPWVRSGVLRGDHSKYMCGSHRRIYLFNTPALLQWYEIKKPPLICEPTIRSFELPRADAESLCLHYFTFDRDQWWIS